MAGFIHAKFMEKTSQKNCGITLLVLVVKSPRNIHDTDAEGFAEGCTNVLHMDEKWKFLLHQLIRSKIYLY